MRFSGLVNMIFVECFFVDYLPDSKLLLPLYRCYLNCTLYFNVLLNIAFTSCIGARISSLDNKQTLSRKP